MRILIDMNLSPEWVDRLADAGIDAVHWVAVGVPDAADADIMRRARDEDRIVPTHDLDFGAILAATNGTKPSVVQIRADDVRPAAIGEVVVRMLLSFQQDLREGALITIEPGRTRSRLLPLRDRPA